MEEKEYIFLNYIPDVTGIYGWEGKKGKFAWTGSNLSVKIKNILEIPNQQLLFKLGTIKARTIFIYNDKKLLRSINLKDNETKKFEIKFEIDSDFVNLDFITSEPSVKVNTGDTRDFTFNIQNIRLRDVK